MNAEIVRSITSRYFNKPPERVTQIIGKGSVNSVFVVESRNTKAVIRCRDSSDSLDEYRKEAWCMEKAAGVGVPVATVLDIGDFADSAYMIQEFLGGKEGRDLPMPATNIWSELGRHARAIHSIPVCGLGLKMADMIEGNSQSSWLRHVDYNIESLNADDELIKLDVITPQQSRITKALFEELRDRQFTFGLNHGDISLKNVIVGSDGVVNLIDWGSAEAAIVPHHDLIQMLKMNMRESDPDEAAVQAFIRGYGIIPSQFDDMLPTLESLLLLRAFDKLRWALDWNVEGLDDFVTHARETVERRCGVQPF